MKNDVDVQYEKIKPYMTKKGIESIKKEGLAVIDEDGEIFDYANNIVCVSCLINSHDNKKN